MPKTSKHDPETQRTTSTRYTHLMKSPCKHPGCAVLVNGNNYCAKHVRPDMLPEYRRRYDSTTRINCPLLRAAAEFRSSKKWQQVRRVKLSVNPLCEDPHGAHARKQTTESAKQVHHIIPLIICAGDERAYDMDNLMSVCTRCHARLEAQERSKRK